MVLEVLSRAVQHEWLVRAVSPAFGRWNPFLASYRRDPYPTYRRLRRRAPRYHHRLFQSWVFTTYDDVAALLANPSMSVDRADSDLFRKYVPFATASGRLQSTLFRSLLMLDPPDHTRVRQLVNRAFTPGSTARLSTRIDALADAHLSRVRAGTPFDVLEQIAVPLPLTVICELLGVPTDRLAELKRWSEILTQLLDPISIVGALRNSQRAIGELATYFDTLFEERRRSPRDDMLTALVRAEVEGDRLSGHELISLVALLLAAGHETTTNLLANAVLALESRPDLRARLIEDPTIVERAVEEILRYDSPVQVTDRVAKQDVALGRALVRRGQMAVLILGAANRDPAAFDDPETIDFDRPQRRHLSFGHGPHFCVGAALARLEAQRVLPRLFHALGDYRVERSGLEWKRSMVLRGPTRLMVVPGGAERRSPLRESSPAVAPAPGP